MDDTGFIAAKLFTCASYPLLNRNKFNHKGYSDPTLYEALTNIHREEVAADKKAAYLPLVYVCSSYAGDIENNVKNAKAYSRYVVKENAIPVTPHLLYPQFMDDGNDAEREMAMHFNYVLLGKCTELWVFGGVVSRGMAREIGVAKKRRMKIRWFDHAMKEVFEKEKRRSNNSFQRSRILTYVANFGD